MGEAGVKVHGTVRKMQKGCALEVLHVGGRMLKCSSWAFRNRQGLDGKKGKGSFGRRGSSMIGGRNEIVACQRL